MARWYVSIGGLAVLGAITLIFFYLAYVVAPMFGGADMEARETQQPSWLAGQGEAGERGRPAGDLFVTVHVKPDDLFTRSGDDLKMTVPVSFKIGRAHV